VGEWIQKVQLLFFPGTCNGFSSMKIPKINERESDGVECRGEASFVVKLSSNSPKLIFPGEGSFALVSENVSLLIKEAFASSLGIFSVSDILLDIGF
jgi:hypothetical protein